MGRKSSCLALLLYSAVPIPNSEAANSNGGKSRRRHIHQELINIVVRDAVQMLFDSLPQSEIAAAAACPPPPNTPSAVSNGQPSSVFTFPPPPTSDEIASQLIRRKDGNEADDSNSDSDCDISAADFPVELKPVQRRKRGRVCSFSNSSAAVRRVPHKKQCHVTPPKSNTDDLSDDNDCLSMTSCQSRLSVTATTPPTYSRQTVYTARQSHKVTAIPPTNYDQVDYHRTIPSTSDQWKNLGKDLNTIATKFTTTIPAEYSTRKVVDSPSSSRSSAGSLIPANMITVAVNIFLWKLLKKWFD